MFFLKKHQSSLITLLSSTRIWYYLKLLLQDLFIITETRISFIMWHSAHSKLVFCLTFALSDINLVSTLINTYLAKLAS